MEDRLYKFANIVDAGGFTKAAARLHISQPALTTAVKKLERELKAELLVRGSHTFRLTPAGEAAYQAARQLRTQTANLKLQIASLANQKVPLRLGAIDAVADIIFTQEAFVSELEQHTHLSLVVDSSQRLAELVERDELDVALVAHSSQLPPTMHAEALGEEPLIFVAPKALAQSTKQALVRGVVPQFLAYNHTSRTHALIVSHFSTHALRLEPRFYSTSPAITLQLLQAGKGVAVLPFPLVAPLLKSGKLEPIPVGESPILARTIAAIYRNGKQLPPSAHVLLDAIRGHFRAVNAHAAKVARS